MQCIMCSMLVFDSEHHDDRVRQSLCFSGFCLTCPPAFIFIYHFVIQSSIHTPTHNPSVRMSHFCPSSVMEDPLVSAVSV